MPPTATATKGKTASNGAAKNGHPAGSDPVKRQILNALRAVARGDFSVKLPGSWDGIDGDIAEAFNEVVGWDNRVLKEMERISTVVGHDGRLGQRAELDAPGSWGEKLR